MRRYVVIDSSVALKWFQQENETFVAEAFDLLLQHRNREITLTAPSLLWLEVLNAMRLRADREQLEGVARELADFNIEWRDTDASLAALAARLTADHGLTAYDACFAALAVELDAPLLTVDRQLLESGACRAVRLGGERDPLVAK